MRSLFTSIAVLGLVAPGWAKPPTFPGYERAAGIQGRLRDAQRRLKAEEEFRKFPRMKKILISMKQGKEEFDDLELSGPKVLREALSDWDAIDKPEEEVAPEDLAILQLLPEALERRYPRGKFDRRERYRASDMLVDALMDDRLHVRKVAIRSLMKIYDSTARLYQPQQNRRMRRSRAKAWKKYIISQKDR